MPGQSRIDAAGALHHIIARGIERRRIFDDDKDRYDFLNRLSLTLEVTGTTCYAWSLIPNHFQMLLRTGQVSAATVMRRLLTGHALACTGVIADRVISSKIAINPYCARKMPAFSNWSATSYLNPLRAGFVDDLNLVNKYPFSGHGVIVEFIAGKVGKLLNIPVEDIWSPGRYGDLAAAHSLICFWAVYNLGMSMTSIAPRFRISTAAVSKSVKRGAEIAKKEGHQLA